jgi:hypothetical protein
MTPINQKQSDSNDTSFANIQDDLLALSDEFNHEQTLADWKQHSELEIYPSQVDVLNINQTIPGSLYLIPHSATWYGDYRGVFLFKEITGDFIVNTRFKITGKHTARPTGSFELAGLMVRAPRNSTMETWEPNQENWLYLSKGTSMETDKIILDSKTNVNSQFVYEETLSNDDWVHIKIIRINHTYLQFYKYDDQDQWTFLKRYDRPDLPNTLQIGMIALADTAKTFGMDPKEFNITVFNNETSTADLIVQFDYVRFQRPQITNEIKIAIENDSVTAEQLVHFLTK